MTTLLEGTLDGSNLRIAVAVAQFNADLTDALLEGCVHTLESHGVQKGNLKVARTPGAFELPVLCAHFAQSGNYDAIVALGAVVRGDTPHFDFVAGECSRGHMDVMTQTGVPIAFGVLTTDTLAQAKLRASRAVLASSSPTEPQRETKDAPESNKGSEAAEVALRMANLLSVLS